ncbi:MAG TPA: hypothetical protein VGL07_16860 [Buttiauxella sp.]|jgi:hypothetical protein
MTTTRARTLVQFDFNDYQTQDVAMGRFYAEYKGTNRRSLKSKMATDVLQAGSLLREADLCALMDLIDKPQYAAASVTERRKMILSMINGALGLFGDVEPPATPAEQPTPSVAAISKKDESEINEVNEKPAHSKKGFLGA